MLIQGLTLQKHSGTLKVARRQYLVAPLQWKPNNQPETKATQPLNIQNAGGIDEGCEQKNQYKDPECKIKQCHVRNKFEGMNCVDLPVVLYQFLNLFTQTDVTGTRTMEILGVKVERRVLFCPCNLGVLASSSLKGWVLVPYVVGGCSSFSGLGRSLGLSQSRLNSAKGHSVISCKR